MRGPRAFALCVLVVACGDDARRNAPDSGLRPDAGAGVGLAGHGDGGPSAGADAGSAGHADATTDSGPTPSSDAAADGASTSDASEEDDAGNSDAAASDGCGRDDEGSIETCAVATPFGTMCEGSRECLGAAGWGSCAPPAVADAPDPTFADDDCDGIDGRSDQGVFVSLSGTDSGTCGLVPATTCRTIAFGIARAAAISRPNVYVQAGAYAEVVPLVGGIGVYGGYDATWQRGPTTDASHRVTITGAKDDGVGGDGEFLTIRAHGLLAPAVVDDVVIQAPDADGPGHSSYAVHVDGSTLTLSQVSLVAGRGADGSAGAAGQDAVSLVAASTGGTGGDGAEVGVCDDVSRGAAGSGSANTCAPSPSVRDMTGGDGGAGGKADTDCACCAPKLTATNGLDGSDAVVTSGASGTNGVGGPANSGGCNSGGGTAGGAGNAGHVANGASGGGGSGGAIANGYWYGVGGDDGSTGENGGGGGGGGGSGGCDDGTDGYGGGGGGGGAGGCAGRSGGGGGGGGGGSFGVLAVNASSVSISACAITRGRGGDGGDGGTGGQGQPGGAGGPIGLHPGASAAGMGGAGAHGGHGGGGGGGAGGRAVGVAWTPGSTVTHACTISGGEAGLPGAGGVSAPAIQGMADDDGSDGANGLGGTLDDTRACVSASEC